MVSHQYLAASLDNVLARLVLLGNFELGFVSEAYLLLDYFEVSTVQPGY
jgi:hypothetical protein